jgi:drug/metabolite transporter (DMT)-like permease
MSVVEALSEQADENAAGDIASPSAFTRGAITERLRSRQTVTTAVALLYILLWSSAFIATRVGVEHSPPLTLLSIRFLAAALLLTVLARVRGLVAPRSRRAWGRLALFGLLNSGLYLGFSYEAVQNMSAGMGSIIAALNPLLLTLLAPWLLGEKLGPVKLIGLVLGFGGVVFVMGARLGGKVDTAGSMALAVVGVSCLVGGTVVYKRWPPREHPLVVNAVQLGIAGLALLPAMLIEHPERTRIDAPLVWSALYLIFVISIGASLRWFWLLEHGEASVVSAYYFLTPIFGLLLAALLLGEPLGPRDGLGLVAVATGIALINRASPLARPRVYHRGHCSLDARVNGRPTPMRVVNPNHYRAIVYRSRRASVTILAATTAAAQNTSTATSPCWIADPSDALNMSNN